MARKGKSRAKKRARKPRESFPRSDLLEAAEDALVEHTSSRVAARMLARDKKLSTRHASRYVEAALAQWEKEGDPSKRAERRAVLEKQIDHVYELCISRGRSYTDRKGRKVTVVDVDARGALAALMMRAQLHGDLDPALKSQAPETEDDMLQLANKHFGGGDFIDAEVAPDDEVPALPASTEPPEAQAS